MFAKIINEMCLNPENIASKRIKHLIDEIDLNSIKTILDIGSWHLKQTIEMAIIFPDAVIHAFEPNPETYKVCVETHENLSATLKNRIFIHQVALSDLVGKIDFFPLDKSKTNSSNEGIASLNPLKKGMDGSLLGDNWIQKKITVNSETLDNWCLLNNIENIDLIWMDVQGAELRVLNGAKKILKNVKAICTEAGLIPYYENHSLKDDMDLFMQLNNFVELKDAFLLTSWSCDEASEADIIYINKNYII